MRAYKRLGLAAGVLTLGAASALAQAPAAKPAQTDQREVARAQEMDARKQPKKAAPKVKAAKAYEANGDVEASRSAATDALAREGNNVEAMQVLARLAAREESWSEAVAHLRKAVRLDPRNASIQLALGQALEMTGDQPGSDAAYAAYRSLQGLKSVPIEVSDSGAKR